MSGLAGVFRADGGSSPVDEAAALLRAMAHRGPDGAAVADAGGAALGVAAMTTTPEDTPGAQPLVDAETGLTVTFDGRLDNRGELCRAGHARGATDAAVVLAAYRRWGPDCAARLRGAFALAIWDARARALFAARDPFGLRPFFFQPVPGGVRWASEAQALARGTGEAINEGYVAERLADRPTSITETLYAGVSRLPMAHALIADGRTAPRTWRYWTPDPEAVERSADPREYHERLRALLLEATAGALRVRGGVTLFLSGGIDAGSVGAAAARLRDGGRVRADVVRATTVAFPGRACDETAAASAVAGSLGLPWEAVPLHLVGDRELLDLARRTRRLPETPNGAIAWPMRRLAVERGHRVVLTGVGAEESFAPQLAELSDLLAGAHLVRAARWLRASPGTLTLGIWGALPAGLKVPLRAVLRRPRVPPWVAPALAARVSLADRLRRPAPPRLATRAATAMLEWATSAEMEALAEQTEHAAAWFGLEERQPFFDRAIVELALAMPTAIRSRPDLPKTVLREAMRPWLPPAVTGVPPAPDFGWIMAGHLERAGGLRRLRESPAVARGWIDAAAVERLYRDLSPDSQRHHWPLWQVLAADYWLRGLESPPPDPPTLAVRVGGAGERGERVIV